MRNVNQQYNDTVVSSVGDPECFDADPDPDLTFQADSDPDPKLF